MKRTLLISMTTLALLSTTLFAGDEIKEQIEEAVKAYDEKDYKGAIEELKYAVAQLEELKSKDNSKLLPKPLDGWKFKETKGNGDAAAMAMFGGGGTSMSGQYIKEQEKVSIEITANSPMMAMMNMAVSNPAMISSDPSMKLYRYKRIKGVKKTEKESIEITLLLTSQLMIKVTGTKLKDEKTLKKYLDGMDMKKIKEELL